MLVRAAALLSLLLAGPALAAPPLSPTADNDAILEAINAADPELTDPPAPVADLLAAAELAETRLQAAATVRDVGDLLTLAATARKIAYRRTGEALHLCALLDASAHVLARAELPASVQADASGLSDETRADLAAHPDAPCMQPPPAPAPPPMPTPAPQVAADPPSRVLSPDARRARGLVRGGAVSLGLAGLAGIGLIVVRAVRVGPYREHSALVDEAEAAGGTTPQQRADMRKFDVFHERTKLATIGLAVSGAVLAVLGGSLLAAGKRHASTRARVTPYGGPFGAGLGLHGTF